MKIKEIKSRSKIKKKYCLNDEQLERVLWKTITYYLSEEELSDFILEEYYKIENKLNLLSQKKS